MEANSTRNTGNMNIIGLQGPRIPCTMCVSHTRYSRMGTVTVKQGEESDTKIIANNKYEIT